MIIFLLLFFIISNAIAHIKNTAIYYSRSTIIGYLYPICFIYYNLDLQILGLEKSKSIFNGLIYYSYTNLIFIQILLVLTCLILVLTSFYPCEVYKVNCSYSITQEHSLIAKSIDNKVNQVNKFSVKELLQSTREHYKIIEYPLIIQFVLIGSIMLLSSNDLITIFLSIELQSYGLYILSTIYRNSESSTGAGLTYFLLGGLSSCIILLGLSLLYINTGNTNLDGLYLIYNIITSDSNLLSYFFATLLDTQSLYQEQELVNNLCSSIFTLNYYGYAIQFSFILVIVGFLFKISAAPFHSWSPGVYDAIPTVTTTFVAIIPKISILILFFDLVYYTSYTWFDFSWTSVLLFSSFLSFIIGSVLGLTQFRIKRLYAYSTISHVGFILLALCVYSIESIQAFFFYIIQYSFSNLNAFFILILIGYTRVFHKKKTKGLKHILFSSLYKEYNNKVNNLSPVEYINDLKGYFHLNPILALSLSITLYSFIGVPPLVGFFAKQMVLSSALDNGNIFICLIAILTSVISAVYYLYIIKHMFFEKSEYINNNSPITVFNTLNKLKGRTNNTSKQILLSSWLTLTIAILTSLILLFIFLYAEIYFLMNILTIYIIY